MKKRDFARLLASVTALTLAATPLASATAQESGSVRDFELPSDQPSPRARAQGPVLEGIPAPRVARPSPTPAPAPQSEVVAVDPGASTPSAEDPFAAIDRMGRSDTATTPAARPVQAAGGASAAGASSPETAAAETAAAASAAAPRIDLPASGGPRTGAAATEPTLTPAGTGGIPWWTWVAALLAVGALGTAAGWFWRGRSKTLMLPAPVIERPRVAPRTRDTLPEPSPERVPERTGPPAELPKVALTRKQADAPRAPLPATQPPAAAPATATATADHDDDFAPESPLRIALEPARLSVSLLNATLSYRILLTNQGENVLRDISIDGDMVSAHASLSQEEQLAAPNSKLENRHLIRALAPGETKVVSGDFALPLPLIRPIRKGEATLFVPLARLRIVAGGEQTQVLVQTSVVGQRSDRAGGGLRPFRLDLGPRIYSELGQRAFA